MRDSSRRAALRALPVRERPRRPATGLYPQPAPGRRPRCACATGGRLRGRRPTHRPRSSASSVPLVGQASSQFGSIPQERYDNMTRILCAVLLIAASIPARSAAQQPTQRQLDSLAAEVRALRVRLDSLRAAVRAPRRATDTARAPVDEDLAGLRAAAAAAVGRDT